MTPEDIKKASAAYKPGGADFEWAQLSTVYHGASRARTKAHLQATGVGLSAAPNPVDMSGLLAESVDRAAVVYAQPPSRWLARDDVRLAETSPEHKLMLRILKRAQYNLAWREADRLRTLHRQVLIRFYPSTERQGVVLRLFEPHQVHRLPNPTDASNVASDSVVMLELGGGRYEIWTSTAGEDGRLVWRVEWTDGDGNPSDSAEPDYPLPMIMSYDSYPGGQAWLNPRQDMLGWVDNLSTMANLVMELGVLQAHNLLVYLRDNPANKMPATTSPGEVITIDRAEDLKNIAPSPALSSCLDVLKVLGRFFAITSGLPGNEFDPERQVLTGAALRVQLGPLLAKREDKVELVPQDEQSAWAIIAALWNSYAAQWGEDQIDETLTLDLEVPDLEAPTTDTEQGNKEARQLLIGTASVIDIIQGQNKCTREEAIARYQRIVDDLAKYPARPQAVAQKVITGPRPSDPPTPGPTPPDNAPDVVAGDSVVQAI